MTRPGERQGGGKGYHSIMATNNGHLSFHSTLPPKESAPCPGRYDELKELQKKVERLGFEKDYHKIINDWTLEGCAKQGRIWQFMHASNVNTLDTVSPRRVTLH